MGTNYYVRTPGCPNACEHCNESQLIHLGKSSAGWKFLHQADPTWPREKALQLWERRAKLGPVEDEYGRPVILEELLTLITEKQGGRAHHTAGLPDYIENFPELAAGLRASDFTVDGYDFCDRYFT